MVADAGLERGFGEFVAHELSILDKCLERTLSKDDVWRELTTSDAKPANGSMLTEGPLGYAEALMKLPFPRFHEAVLPCSKKFFRNALDSLPEIGLRTYLELFDRD